MDPAFPKRVALLIGVLAAVAAVDVLRHGDRARRPGEYAFLLAAGLAGALFGALVDQVDVTLSPEYFVIGKGLDPDDLRRAAAGLGAQAGAVGGLVAAGVLLLGNGPARPGRLGPPLAYAALARALAIPLGCALAAALPGAAAGAWLDPLGLRLELPGLVPEPRVPAFLAVWGIHAGLYAGGAAGTVAAVVACWRRRQRSAD